MIHIDHLFYRYNEHILFQDFSLHVKKGERLAIMGPSGVGKTTLLRLIARLESPQSGQIQIAEPLAYLSQGDDSIPWASVHNNALLGLRLSGQKITPTIVNESHYLLTQIGLGPFIKSFPHELSGGMRRRLNWARTALLHRSIVLLDEPLIGLDPKTRQDMYTIMDDLFQAKTLIMVTHQQDEALRMTERTVMLQFENLE